MNKLYLFAAFLTYAIFFSSFTQANDTMQLVNYFEIPVSDMARAKGFYERIFGYPLTLQEIDGIEMALFPDPESGVITGALAKGESYVPGRQGSRLYFAVSNIDEVLQKVKAHGGELNYEKTDIGALGFVAEFVDSEGNIIALHQDNSK